MIVTTTLNRWLGGFVETTDTAATATWGRREALLSVGDLGDMEAVEQVAASNLGVVNDVVTSIVAEMDEVDAASGYSAYTDYQNGDSVTAATIGGATATVRCHSITVTEDENAYLQVFPEFITARDVLEQKVNRWLSRTNDGALAGRSTTSTPVSNTSDAILNVTVASVSPIQFSAGGGQVAVDGDAGPKGRTSDVRGFLYRIEVDATDSGAFDTDIDITVNGTTVSAVTIEADEVRAVYDMPNTELTILEYSDIVIPVVVTAGGHAGLTIRCMVASIEI